MNIARPPIRSFPTVISHIACRILRACPIPAPPPPPPPFSSFPLPCPSIPDSPPYTHMYRMSGALMNHEGANYHSVAYWPPQIRIPEADESIQVDEVFPFTASQVVSMSRSGLPSFSLGPVIAAEQFIRPRFCLSGVNLTEVYIVRVVFAGISLHQAHQGPVSFLNSRTNFFRVPVHTLQPRKALELATSQLPHTD